MLDPAGPVAASELQLMELTWISMAVVFALVVGLFIYVLVRFRDRPNNPAPYTPNADGDWRWELVWFLIPVVLLTIIAVPTVTKTYALDRLPTGSHAEVIDVTSLTWKWLFEYPTEHIATVNTVVIPVGRPVLFRLTAHSAMNTLWIPQLGGMEYTMAGRVLPLWLEASRAGHYRGSSGQYSGLMFEKMSFHVVAVDPAQFKTWTHQVRQSHHPLTNADYHQLLRFGVTPPAIYSGYPPDTFPHESHRFTLKGTMYDHY